MRLCLSCREPFDSEGWTCPNCGFEPEIIEGYPAFAPELARSNDGYDPEYFEILDKCIEGSFWIRARRDLFIWATKQYFRGAEKFLEIGCATGLMLSFFSEAFPNMAVSASDIFSDGLQYIPNRIPDATLFQADARRLPFENEFDVIGAFDVIEHIEEDQRVLEEMFRATRPGGGIIVSVPHHPFLWSQRDEFVLHKRRYTRRMLIERVERAGFDIARATAFISLPFPAMIVESLRNRKPRKDYDPLEGLRKKGIANGLLTGILRFEKELIRAGLSFPFGGSLLVVATKPK